MKTFNGVKVFAATMVAQREVLGETVTAWLKDARVDYVLVEPNDYFMTTASGGTTHDPMPPDRLRDLLSGGRRVFADAEEGTEIYQVRQRAGARWY